MAEIKALHGLRFTDKAGQISTLVCPPYDIVNEEERGALLQRNPHNLIRLELPREGDTPYDVAGDTLNTWLKEGILAEDDRQGLYIYEEQFTVEGVTKCIKGVQCRVKLEPFEKGVVLPHEETLSKAKADRFELMKACGCNFSAIYSLFFDADRAIVSRLDKLSGAAPTQEFTDAEGITHRLWCVYDQTEITAIEKLFADKKLYIADGHHRYETALNYKKHLADSGVNAPEADYVLMTLVNMEHEGLVVFPTHRIVRDMPDYDTQKLLDNCKAQFELIPMQNGLEGAKTLLADEYSQGEKAFVLYDGKAYHGLRLKDKTAMDSCASSHSEHYRGLDVSVLHSLILERALGIDRENMANQKNLIYTRDAAEGVAQVDAGKANCCFLLNPTRVEQIAGVAAAGDKMPQKSTYFYPKIITGTVMNKLL